MINEGDQLQRAAGHEENNGLERGEGWRAKPVAHTQHQGLPPGLMTGLLLGDVRSPLDTQE